MAVCSMVIVVSLSRTTCYSRRVWPLRVKVSVGHLDKRWPPQYQDLDIFVKFVLHPVTMAIHRFYPPILRAYVKFYPTAIS